MGPNGRTLVFADRRSAGGFPVTTPDGTVVANIRNRRGGTRFSVEDASGATLCSGTTSWLGMSNRWQVAGPDGAPLLEVRKAAIRSRADVELAAGGVLTVEGSWAGRSFSVRDGEKVLLRATPNARALSLHAYSYAVDVLDDLPLADAVAIVHVWRQLQKRDDSAAGAAVTTAAVG